MRDVNSVAGVPYHCRIVRDYRDYVRPTDLRFSRARPYRARLRDATRRAKRAAEAAGQTNGRASAATASWPALDSSLEQRSETVRTVLIRNSRLLRCGRFLA